MKTTQISYNPSTGWANVPADCSENTLVLAFAERPLGEGSAIWDDLRRKIGTAKLLACSTAGEIQNAGISANNIAGSVTKFAQTTIRSAQAELLDRADSFEAGKRIARALPHDELTAVFVLVDGLAVNGSKLVNGLLAEPPTNVTVNGGLAADGDKFQSTWVVADGKAKSHSVVAAGFYGAHIQFSYVSQGGFDKFGVERRISCVGRKLVLGGRVEDELDAALAAMPAGTKRVGFYSYGEVAPNGVGDPCELSQPNHEDSAVL